MEKEKCRLVNIIKYDRFYDTVNFKACWKYKENISTQQASLTEEGMLGRYIQARDITLKVMRGRWLSRLPEPHDTEQGTSSSGSWRSFGFTCVARRRKGMWGESKKGGSWRICWVMHGGLNFILEGMLPLKGFPAEKSDINVTVITASSLICLEHILGLGLRTVHP